MKIAKAAVISLVLFGILGLYRGASAEPFARNEMFPDVSRAEKTVWYCDGGKTLVIMYRAIYPADQEHFRLFLVVFTQNTAFVMDNKAETDTNWFLGPSLKELRSVTAKEWFVALRPLSLNFHHLLVRLPNDCAKE